MLKPELEKIKSLENIHIGAEYIHGNPFEKLVTLASAILVLMEKE